MKMTHLELLSTRNAFNQFQQEMTEVGVQKRRKIPVKLAYAIRVNRARIESILRLFEEQRIDTLRDFAKPKKGRKKGSTDIEMQIDEKTGQETAVFKNDKAEEEFTEKFQELLDTEVEIRVHKIPFKIIEKMEEIEEEFLGSLEFMIEEFDELEEETGKEVEKASENGQATGKEKEAVEDKN